MLNLNHTAVLILHSSLLYPKLICFDSNWLVIWLPFSFNDYLKKVAKLPAN